VAEGEAEDAVGETDTIGEEIDTTEATEESATTHAEEVRHCRIHRYHEGQKLTKHLQETVAPAQDRLEEMQHGTQEHDHRPEDRVENTIETTDQEMNDHQGILRNHNLRDQR
jgi:uncharacterized protein YicC (UPF0701 family)